MALETKLSNHFADDGAAITIQLAAKAEGVDVVAFDDEGNPDFYALLNTGGRHNLLRRRIDRGTHDFDAVAELHTRHPGDLHTVSADSCPLLFGATLGDESDVFASDGDLMQGHQPGILVS